MPFVCVDEPAGHTESLALNLAAIAASQPQLETALSRIHDDEPWRAATGRDGQPTYWMQLGAGGQWLGHTSMPGISSPALIDAFDPGMGNVLLPSFGHGLEVELLLGRMLPHQAVFVIEESPLALKVSLSLLDFSKAIKHGRLRMFVGDDAWTDMERFLIDERGYLVPERILARPWLDRAATQEITHRLVSVSQTVARIRSQGPAASQRRNDDPRINCLAILSNSPDPHTRRVALALHRAAESLGWAVRRFCLDDPRLVHPSFIGEALQHANCKAQLLINSSPANPPCVLPKIPTAALLTPDRALPDDFLQWPDHVRIAVQSHGQLTAIPKDWIKAGRAALVPPAANTSIDSDAKPLGSVVGIIGQHHDLSPQSAGLNLASHQRLWHCMLEMLREMPDRLSPDKPNDFLRAAEAKLGFNLTSESVREGIRDRIMGLMWPTIVCEIAEARLSQRGLECVRLTPGWTWENGEQGPTAGNLGLVIIPWANADSTESALSAAARGLPVLLHERAHDELQQISPDTARFCATFARVNELVAAVDRWRAAPDVYWVKAVSAQSAVLANHSWPACLSSILSLLGHHATARL